MENNFACQFAIKVDGQSLPACTQTYQSFTISHWSNLRFSGKVYSTLFAGPGQARQDSSRTEWHGRPVGDLNEPHAYGAVDDSSADSAGVGSL